MSSASGSRSRPLTSHRSSGCSTRSEPIDTPDDVLRVVDWYRARWTIEEYFKALKTGCALEERQLEDLPALVNVLALFIPIAWRLLLMKSEARDAPTAPATTILEPEELEVLRLAGGPQKALSQPDR